PRGHEPPRSRREAGGAGRQGGRQRVEEDAPGRRRRRGRLQAREGAGAGYSSLGRDAAARLPGGASVSGAADRLSLRPVARDELPLLLDMLRRFYVEDRIPLDEPRVRRGLEQLLADPSSGALLFAEAGGERVGYLVLGWCFSIEQG